jgi:broad specificity phosphatase PhoE
MADARRRANIRGAVMHLILVRHGEPMTGPGAPTRDPPLTPLGHRQAELAGALLGRVRPDVLISSGMARADQTAAPTARLLDLSVGIEPRIAEIDAELGTYGSVAALKTASKEVWAKFLADPIRTLGGDPDAFKARVRAGFADIVAKHPGKTVAVFTHGFPINLTMSDALGVDVLAKLGPAHASVSRFAPAGRGLQLISFNETGHLTP